MKDRINPDSDNSAEQPQPAVTEKEPKLKDEQAGKRECMSCKAVAFTTPLMVSGYFIYTHRTKEKVATLPIAAKWTGRRIGYHRVIMCSVVPISICYFSYSYMFDFGFFTPGLKDLKPPKSAEEAVQQFVDSTNNDVDSFTRGTLQLADWLTGSLAKKKESGSDIFGRLKRVFSSMRSDVSDEMKKLEKGVSDKVKKSEKKEDP